MWLIDPLFGVILNGSDIVDADFCPVSIGFAVSVGLCLITVVFVAFAGFKRIRQQKLEEMQL